MPTSRLDKLVAALTRDAGEIRARAFAYLGHRPGPGIDLTVTQLTNRAWKVEGRTPCGHAFILKLYGGDRYGADNQMALAEFRRRVGEWGLTMETKWPAAKVEEL